MTTIREPPTPIGHADFAAEVKWLPELDVERRLKGDYVWVRVGLVFQR